MVDNYAGQEVGQADFYYVNTYSPYNLVMKSDSPPPAYESVFPQLDGSNHVYPQIVNPYIYNNYQ